MYVCVYICVYVCTYVTCRAELYNEEDLKNGLAMSTSYCVTHVAGCTVLWVYSAA